MANINDFKAKLAGGGARANQFKVTLPFPGYASVGGEIEDMAFLCKATSLPAMTVGNIDVKFRGRDIKIAGDRTIDAWTVTVYNDYQVDAFIDHLDRNGNTVKSYTLRGAFPTSVGEIGLDYEEKTSIEVFPVNFSYQFFETNTTT